MIDVPGEPAVLRSLGVWKTALGICCKQLVYCAETVLSVADIIIFETFKLSSRKLQASVKKVASIPFLIRVSVRLGNQDQIAHQARGADLLQHILLGHLP